MIETYPFNRGFRLKILALCLDPVWMARYGAALILPEYFEQDDEEDIAAAILEYYKAYGTTPRDPDDVIVLCEDDHEDIVLDLFDRRSDDLRLASDMVVQFAREQAAKIAILDSVDDVKAGRLQKVIERMEGAIAVGDSLMSPGIDVIRDVDKWLYKLWSDKVATGWYHLDTLLEGGLGPGELGLIMGPTSRGKTMALINIGFGAAGIGSGKNIIHVTHELSARLTAKRYAARMVFRFPKVGSDISAYEDELYDAAKKLMPGNIRIVDSGGKTSIEDIKGYIDRLIAEGFRVDMIIDDAPEMIESSRRYNQRRFEYSDVCKSLRQLGVQYEVPVWSTTQSNRASLTKEVVSLQDIAEDIGKANIADVIIAVCQTREEEDTEQCRLFVAKNRDGVKHIMYRAKFYGDCQAIITTGIAERKKRDA